MRIVAALLFFSAIAFGDECSVDGVVVDSVTNAPIARASVTANKNTPVLTDLSGKWSIEHLPCGDVVLAASRQTFLADRALPDVHLDAGTPVHDVKIRLIPQGVVTGRVVDDRGDPIEGIQIAMMAPLVINGERQMVFRGGFAASNDIGEYRLAGLSGGKHVFCANPGIRATRVRSADVPYAEQCSGPIVLAPGFNTTVDFQLHSVVPRHVRGVISGAPDGTTPQIVLDCNSGAFSTGVGADRAFDIVSTTTGACSLIATAFDDSDRLAATRQIEIGSTDIEGLHLHLEKSVAVAGTVRIYSATGQKPGGSQFPVFLIPSSRNIPTSTQIAWNDERTEFTFTNVTPGNYRFQFDAPLPFYIQSARMASRDIADSEFTVGPGTPGIEVVLSDNGGVIEGDVSADERPTVAGIVVQQDGVRRWFGKADAKGHFKIEGVPPGDYKVSAWDDLGFVEYSNPAWMQLNAKIVAATVQAGQSTQVKLIRQIAPPE